MSGVLLDTTVIIDLCRAFRPTVLWAERQGPGSLFLSTVSVGEIMRGVYRSAVASSERLAQALSDTRTMLLPRFDGRILSYDLTAAEIWGRLMAEGEARGLRPAADDAKIAAIALRHGLIVATSNTKDFASLCPIVDPRSA
jgi:toxin FitB